MKYWIVEEPENAGPCNIEAPTYGVAVEYFLASHGMVSYGPGLYVHVTEDPPTEDHDRWETVSLVLGINEWDKADLARLDTAHGSALHQGVLGRR